MFGGLLRDMERDPIFGAHSRAMSRMMGSFFPDMGDFGFPGQQQQQQQHRSNDMMPFGMGMGGMQMFPSFPGFPMMDMNGFAAPQNGGMAFSSTQVMSMQSGQNGQPIVYQASSTTRQAPGGVKETIKTVQDSRSGLKKMSVGRQLGERGHVVEREENLYTGQREENEELLNMDFDEKDHFDREWRNRAHGRVRVPAASAVNDRPSITYGADVGHSRAPYRVSDADPSARAVTYTPTVTIEELSDTEDAVPSAHSTAHVPHIPTTTSASSRRAKERRQKSYAKRSKKY